MDNLNLNKHISGQFNAELEYIRTQVMTMGGLVEQQLSDAITAMHNQDSDLAKRVIDGDKQVNMMEVAIDEACVRIIAKRQPTASDLRLVMAIIKTIAELERIGDVADKICRTALEKFSQQHQPLLVSLESLGRHTVQMLHDVLDAFARMDLDEAVRIYREDKKVDQEYEGIVRQLMTYMMEDPRTIPSVLTALFCARSIERIGDRCQNICEYIFYFVKGQDFRHVGGDELDKLLAAPAAGKVLSRYGRILAGAVPEIEPCIGCTQPGRWHCYDVWQHTAVAVELLDVAGMDDKNARILRWSVFLHDLAKPECRTVGPDGAAHFPGHNQAGSKMARSILLRLKAPTYLVESASALVAIHDGALPSDDAGILNMLNRYGAAFLQRLCRLKLADLAAHARNAGVMQREQQVRAFEGRMLELSATACYTVGQLAVNGASLMDAGIAPGPAVGKALNTLLRAVMEGRLPNEKAALLAALEKEGLL